MSKLKQLILIALILITAGCSGYKCIDGEVYHQLGLSNTYVKSNYYVNKCIGGKNAKP